MSREVSACFQTDVSYTQRFPSLAQICVIWQLCLDRSQALSMVLQDPNIQKSRSRSLSITKLLGVRICK